MPGPHQDSMVLGANGLWGTDIVGRGSIMPSAQSELDAARMGIGRVPSAEYPDGYLGTIPTRREDRLLDSVKNRVNQKAYQRGVHKGERVDPSDYYWPMGLDPQRGLRNQRRGIKTAPVEVMAPPPHLVNDGRADTVATEPGRIDKKRREQLSRLMPTWSV